VRTDYYVYVHRRMSDNKPFYVGKGTNDRAWKPYGRSKWWKNVAEKHDYYVEIVFSDLSEEDAYRVEIDVIKEFRYFNYPLVNLTSGGEGVRELDPDLKAQAVKKATESRKNSEKWKAGIIRAGEKLRGRKLSDEHRKKISDGNIGKVLSDQTRAKLSETKKSCPRAQEHIRSIAGKNKDVTIYKFYSKDGQIFEGTRTEFANWSGIRPNDVAKLFQTKKTRLTVLGWTLNPEHFRGRSCDLDKT
jgi:hypothetical protein